MVIEEDSAMHVLVVLWKLKCTNEHCKSERNTILPNDTQKQVISLKLVVDLSFRALVKGYAAAKCFTSIMNLNVPITCQSWAELVSCSQ